MISICTVHRTPYPDIAFKFSLPVFEWAMSLTLQPLSSSAVQIFSPIPCAPPVTIATLPWIFIFSLSCKTNKETAFLAVVSHKFHHRSRLGYETNGPQSARVFAILAEEWKTGSDFPNLVSRVLFLPFEIGPWERGWCFTRARAQLAFWSRKELAHQVKEACPPIKHCFCSLTVYSG